MCGAMARANLRVGVRQRSRVGSCALVGHADFNANTHSSVPR
jgi:hypothetical protein